jgi:hypothetical protein
VADFATFVKENRKKCKLCAFFEDNPEEAKSMRAHFPAQPTKIASVVADYLIATYKYHVTAQNVHDHFRRGHEIRKEAE